MKPKKPGKEIKQAEMFRVELEELIDRSHPLVKLAAQVPWERFDKAFDPLYAEGHGRPATATRLMVGLHYLKHTFGLSDEETVARWVENPYWQYFCGEKYFTHEPPVDPSSLTRWRKRLGEAGMEELLAGTIEAGLTAGVIKPASFQRVTADTTVQEKAVAYPTDARLHNRAREKLVALAAAHGVKLRQSYARVGRRAAVMSGRYSHARQMKRARKEQKKIKNYLGRVVRDVERKIVGDAAKEAVFAAPLSQARRLLEQKRRDSGKLYSLHAPEVECIAKGKAHKKYEFGVKVAVATTAKENFVIGMKALHGAPYDGHTLAASIAQVERVTGQKLEGCLYVDLGYRGHDYEGPAEVCIVRRGARRLPRTLRKWLNRRSAIEPIIGHMKADGRLNRNHLLGKEGDRINAVLCGCGQNLRKLLAQASFCLFFFAEALLEGVGSDRFQSNRIAAAA